MPDFQKHRRKIADYDLNATF
eukprot:SAG11_NODE_37651_length_256_cov_0.439490_2_plen_20_part_01